MSGAGPRAVRAFEVASERFAGLVGAVEGGAWDRPTASEVSVRELVVHGWDLARALGADAALEPVSAAYLWELVGPHVEEMRAMGAYGDGARGRLPEGSSLDARVLDAFGRRG